MNRLLFVTAIAGTLAIPVAAAAECPCPPKPIVVQHVKCAPHRIVRHHIAKPKVVVKVVEKVVREVVQAPPRIIREVVQAPPRVIYAAPQRTDCCRPIRRPVQNCCPPGQPNIYGLEPCNSPGYSIVDLQERQRQRQEQLIADCDDAGGTRTIDPRNGRPACYVPPAAHRVPSAPPAVFAQTAAQEAVPVARAAPQEAAPAPQREELVLPAGAHLADVEY